MSRKIDYTDPSSWSEEDLLYLHQYDQKAEQVKARAEELGVELPGPGGPGMAKAVPDITTFSDEQLQAEVDRRADLAAEADAGNLPEYYADWNKKQLQTEIRNRNATRDEDEKLPASGTKEDLVELLEADDASVEA